MKISRNNRQAYTTKDGSEIRELLHPDNTKECKQQSLAEATVLSGQITSPHFHKQTEEIYFILSGSGEIFLGEDSFPVQQGDSVLIKPEQVHYIKNTGDKDLRFLCCCSPAYQHNDTFLVDMIR